MGVDVQEGAAGHMADGGGEGVQIRTMSSARRGGASRHERC